MTKESLEQALCEFSVSSPLNYVEESVALEPRAAGIKMYEEPIFGYSAADDPWYDRLQQPEAVGPHFQKPDFWVPGAKTVISFFVSKSPEVREDNAKVLEKQSIFWLHARKEGQVFIDAMCQKAVDLLRAAGYQAVAPSIDERFHAGALKKNENGEEVKFPFTSNWSERHVAFVSGMGTFGLSKGLITRKGIAGRFGSIITDWEAEPLKREYTDIYEWCNKCGACVRNCPADAITLEKGKDHPTCAAYLRSDPTYAPRYGCGKCQVAVPCEHGIPGRK